MVTPHASHAAALLRDGRVLVAGGLINDRLDGKVSAAAELYDPGSASWTATATMLSARFGHSATLTQDGAVLISGGYSGKREPLASAERYDPSTGSWKLTGTMGKGRGGQSATLLSDGTVLVAGGSRPEAPKGLASAELYHTASGTWTTAANMGSARQGHTATLLADGTVLVVGGGGEVRLEEGPAYGATAERYDPASGRWTITGSLNKARAGHTATLLPDGMVLVVGGSVGDDATARSAELYDPASGTWRIAGSMADARTGHTAAPLPDGTVLVTGGVGLGNTPAKLASAEVYDPATRRWRRTAAMLRTRVNHTATLLPDGSVLVFGDYDYESRASAELYVPASRPPQ